jgi:hypothetical protein
MANPSAPLPLPGPPSGPEPILPRPGLSGPGAG